MSTGRQSRAERSRTTSVVFFVDVLAPFPYSAETLSASSTGGTVAAVIRVAERLAVNRSVFVIERRRVGSSGRAEYCGIETLKELPAPETVIMVRYPLEGAGSLDDIAARYPSARLIHWHHLTFSVSGRLSRRLRKHERQYWLRYSAMAQKWLQHRVDIVGTSRFHERNIRMFVQRATGMAQQCRITHIYNPIDPGALPVFTPEAFDDDRMIFFSRADRGLRRSIALFEYLRRRWPALRLSVATPDRRPFAGPVPRGVEFLGSLPRAELYEQIQGALCTFYPNTWPPECFGYVYGESNALGVPVLAHDLGAAREVLDPGQPLTDCLSRRAIASRIEQWRNGLRPHVALRPEITLDAVSMKWEDEISRG